MSVTDRPRVKLPAPVARIYEAVAELEAMYPGRSFTPDGHLVGSIGEVVAAEALRLTLHPQSHPGHDAFDEAGDVQIKMIGRKASSVAMYAASVRLVVLQLVSTTEAEIIYDGPGTPAWEAAGPIGKNGQRVIRLSRLAKLDPAGVEFVDENGGGRVCGWGRCPEDASRLSTWLAVMPKAVRSILEARPVYEKKRRRLAAGASKIP